MSNRMYYPVRGSLNREMVLLFGNVVTSTNGAIASQVCKGFTVARTGTGVYTITLDDTYAALLHGLSSARGSVTAGKGQISNVTAVNLATKTITVTFYRPDTQAAADVTDGNTVVFTLILSRVPLS